MQPEWNLAFICVDFDPWNEGQFPSILGRPGPTSEIVSLNFWQEKGQKKWEKVLKYAKKAKITTVNNL